MRSGFWDFICVICNATVKRGGPRKGRDCYCSDCKIEVEAEEQMERFFEEQQRKEQEQLEPENLLIRIKNLEERITNLEERITNLEEGTL